MHIDSPQANDNRHYDYTSFPDEERREYDIIADYIPIGASVLDLGCGNGTLLSRLKKEKNVMDAGMEISESGVAVCKTRGLNVILGRIDAPLPYSDNQFDVSICNVTIQMVMYPEILLREMKRVSRRQVVTFPNFGFWKNRFEMFFQGRMPRHMLFGYQWYSTGHIHQLSISDFQDLIKSIGGLKVVDRWIDRTSVGFRNMLNVLFPNLFQLLAVFVLQKDDAHR